MALSQVNCILVEGDQTILEKSYQAQNGRFNVVLDALEPSEDYSLLVWGLASNLETITRSYRGDIEVKGGEETLITMTWTPFKINITHPVEDIATNNIQPLLCWNGPDLAASYDIQIDTSATFRSPILITGSTTDTSYQPTLQPLDGSYLWRLRAVDQRGYRGNWTPPRRLTLDVTGPEAPNIIRPINHSVITGEWVHFQWTLSEGAITHEIILDDDMDFSSPVLYQKALLGNWFFPRPQSFPMENGDYYWRIRASDWLGNWGPWSMVYHFDFQYYK